MHAVHSTEISKIPLLKTVRSQNHSFQSVLPPELAQTDSLVFISTPEMLELAIKHQAHGFIILEKIYPQFQTLVPENSSLWTTPHVQAAMVYVLPLFDRRPLQRSIHPTAVVSPKAKIGHNVHVGPYVVIEDFAVVGDHSTVHAHGFVGSFCEIGKNCILNPHVVIGADGFGYFTDKNFQHHKIPQIGKVVLEDFVELGAYCAIDRATLHETRIKSGTKLDNFCHIAHNCTIGENAIAAAAFKVAGSTTIGKNLMSSGSVDLNGHISVADNVVLTARTGVVSSIHQQGAYGGFPAMPHKENLKVMSSLPSLPTLRKQVARLFKHLNLEEKD